MILYHGSNIAIEEINLEKSRPCKDFGRGFYLSEDEEQAKQMAIFKALTLGGEPIVTKFHFNEDVMTSAGLNIRIFKDYSKEWADFVFLNRENDIPTSIDDASVRDIHAYNKLLHDGQLLIIRDGKTYNTMGAEIH